MADLVKIFGEEFLGLPIDGYKTWPAIDGTYLGLEFFHLDGATTRIAIPQESLDRLLQEIGRAAAKCAARRAEVRH